MDANNYSGFSDSELLEISSWKESPIESKGAFSEFYKRHIKTLWATCHKICNNFKNFSQYDDVHELAKDITAITMSKAYRNAKTYNKSKGLADTWLNSIAKYTMIDLIRDGHFNSRPLNDNINTFYNDDSSEMKSPPSLERKLLDEAMSTLSEREKDILLTYFTFTDGRSQFPEDELSILCSRHNTTPINIRQIKCRAIKKIKEYINIHNNGEIK